MEPVDREYYLGVIAELRSALRKIVHTNHEFRLGLPDDWEGDSLQDAIDEAAFLISTVTDKLFETEGKNGKAGSL